MCSLRLEIGIRLTVAGGTIPGLTVARLASPGLTIPKAFNGIFRLSLFARLFRMRGLLLWMYMLRFFMQFRMNGRGHYKRLIRNEPERLAGGDFCGGPWRDFRLGQARR